MQCVSADGFKITKSLQSAASVLADPVVGLGCQILRQKRVLFLTFDTRELATQVFAGLLGDVVGGLVERKQVAVVAELPVSGRAGVAVAGASMVPLGLVARIAKLGEPATHAADEAAASVAKRGEEIGALGCALGRCSLDTIGGRIAACAVEVIRHRLQSTGARLPFICLSISHRGKDEEKDRGNLHLAQASTTTLA